MDRKANESTLKDVLKEMVRTFRLEGKLDQTKLREVWPDLMGEGIARQTREIKIRQGKLFLSIQAPALRQELSYGREKIRDIVNKALGEERIKEVIIR